MARPIIHAGYDYVDENEFLQVRLELTTPALLV